MGVGTAQGHTCFLLDQWGRGLGPRLPPFALLLGVVDYLSKLHQRESLATVEKEEERASLGGFVWLQRESPESHTILEASRPLVLCGWGMPSREISHEPKEVERERERENQQELQAAWLLFSCSVVSDSL